MKILYFAWLRERVGKAEEDQVPPDSVATVGELLDWIEGLGPGHARALEDRSVVRVAVNQEFAKEDAAIKSGDEVALFPPMTGG